ncbi:MFS transporter [Ancylobacter dichloromethanicus]|nr:MFS transporter [Ancylobacter dichloromethanicus]
MTGVAMSLIANEFGLGAVEHGVVGAASLAGMNRRATILASVPWFLQDLSTYGIGIFTPTIIAVALADRVGRIPLQILGFIGCAAGLLIASFAAYYDGAMGTALIFIGFMMFNFMTNLGPNAQTYLLAGEIFPPTFAARRPAAWQPSPRSAPCLPPSAPHPARLHRPAIAALRPRRDVAARRRHHLVVPH